MTIMFKNKSKLNNFDIYHFNSLNVSNNKKIIYPFVNSINLADNIIISNKNKKYTLIKKIGEGGFGICYMAKDENNEFYAIKKINIQNKEVMIKEINILKIMNNSKYSVNFFESIEKEDNIYIVMELCDDNLKNLLEKKNGKLDIV